MNCTKEIGKRKLNLLGLLLFNSIFYKGRYFIGVGMSVNI